MTNDHGDWDDYGDYDDHGDYVDYFHRYQMIWQQPLIFNWTDSNLFRAQCKPVKTFVKLTA